MCRLPEALSYSTMLISLGPRTRLWTRMAELSLLVAPKLHRGPKVTRTLPAPMPQLAILHVHPRMPQLSPVPMFKVRSKQPQSLRHCSTAQAHSSNDPSLSTRTFQLHRSSASNLQEPRAMASPMTLQRFRQSSTKRRPVKSSTSTTAPIS